MEIMAVPTCTICASQQIATSENDLQDGDYCPICYNPTCRSHLTVVRFRWRENGQTDSALICKTCKTRYEHRYWDSARRDWIS